MYKNQFRRFSNAHAHWTKFRLKKFKTQFWCSLNFQIHQIPKKYAIWLLFRIYMSYFTVHKLKFLQQTYIKTTVINYLWNCSVEFCKWFRFRKEKIFGFLQQGVGFCFFLPLTYRENLLLKNMRNIMRKSTL